MAWSEESGFMDPKDGWMDVAFCVVSHTTEESRTKHYLDYALARAEACLVVDRNKGTRTCFGEVML
jgi:hypothetical protein